MTQPPDVAVAEGPKLRTVGGMSEDSEAVRGPVMLAATNMLKPPPPVIGSLNKEITLPRTVKLTTLAGVAVGAVLGFVVGLVVFGASLEALMYGPTLGGALGWTAMNFSPLQGESLAKWLGLQLNSTRKQKLYVGGQQVRLYVGIAPLRRTAAGRIRMVGGGVPVDSVKWDERGVPQQEIPGAERFATAVRPTKGRRKLTAAPHPSSGGRKLSGTRRSPSGGKKLSAGTQLSSHGLGGRQKRRGRT